MPFCSLTLTAKKPSKTPENPKTIGEHIKKRRLEMALTQAQLARRLSVSECTITGWKKNRSNPTSRCFPTMVELSGYISQLSTAPTLGQKMVQYRRRRGINQETMAEQLGVDPTTLGRWDRGEKTNLTLAPLQRAGRECTVRAQSYCSEISAANAC